MLSHSAAAVITTALQPAAGVQQLEVNEQSQCAVVTPPVVRLEAAFCIFTEAAAAPFTGVEAVSAAWHCSALLHVQLDLSSIMH